MEMWIEPLNVSPVKRTQVSIGTSIAIIALLLSAAMQVGGWIWFWSRLSGTVAQTQLQTTQLATQMSTISFQLAAIQQRQVDQSVQLNAIVNHAIQSQH